MTGSLKKTLTLAVRRLLRPLVRILLRHGVRCDELMECAKKVYVDVAREEFGTPGGRKPPVGRAAAMTGLARQEVARLASLPDQDGSADFRRYQRAVRVITGWIREKQFADGRGRPAVLPLEGAGKSFAGLVKRFIGDLPASAILDELLQVGAVKKLSGNRLKLMERAYIPRTGKDEKEEKIRILGADVADLISIIGHNLTHRPGRAYFQRKVAYDNLPTEFLQALRSRAGKKAQEFLEDLDRQLSRHDRDSNPKVKGTGRKKAVLGIYYFEDDFHEE